MSYLIFLALFPPLILMVYIYRKDQVEREPVGLILRTVLFGALSVIPTLVLEILLGNVIGFVFDTRSLLGMLVQNYIGIALVEEFCKMSACKKSVWKNREFNYTFDGVVYSVASAIGFAALENIEYVFAYGNIPTAITRAVTAIPAHTIFGIFMGVHLGMAKFYEVRGYDDLARKERRLALLIPVILHGTYDFMCGLNNSAVGLLFFVFIIAMDINAIRHLNKAERSDINIL